MKTKDNSYLISDPFKKAALKQILAKDKSSRTYPINRSDLLTVKNCPLCKSDDTEPITELYLNFNLKILSTDICRNCLFTFRSVSPNLGWFKKCWRMIQTKKLEVFNPIEERSRKNRYEKYYRTLSKYVSSGKALDIGAAYGTGSNIFRAHGFDVEAVEPEINKINYLRKALEIPVVGYAIEDFVRKNKKYDLVIFAQCFEHINDPGFVIANIKNLLRSSDSTLYLEIPIIWNYVNWSDALYLPHKSNFHEDNIINLMADNGFEILEMFYLWDQTQDGRSPSDVGIVAKYVGKSSPKLYSTSNSKFNIDNIRTLYRKGLPPEIKIPNSTIIRYSVPYIDQFFQTLRLKDKKLAISKTIPGFLEFYDAKTD